MKIDLHNFFLHYDPKNPKHVAAVEQLERDLEKTQPNLIEDEGIVSRERVNDFKSWLDK